MYTPGTVPVNVTVPFPTTVNLDASDPDITIDPVLKAPPLALSFAKGLKVYGDCEGLIVYVSFFA